MKKRLFAGFACAALALCLCACQNSKAEETQGAAVEDVQNWNGSVAGVSVENATEDVEVTARITPEGAKVTITLLKPEQIPYAEIEELKISRYTLYTGETAAPEAASDRAAVEDGRSSFLLALTEGAEKLVIEELECSKKADAPITIAGNWEIDLPEIP